VGRACRSAVNRLRELHHGSRHSAERILQAYLYDVDARGNRTRTREVTPLSSGSGTNTTLPATDAGIVYTGIWTNDGSFQRSTAPTARLGLVFFGTTGIELTMGTGPDHSRFDVYIDGSLWQAFDGYAATDGERTIPLELTGGGAHLLEIRNRREKSASSSGYVVRFKQLVAQQAHTVRQIDYQYDALSRLISADYADNSREYAYLYDVAGNRRQEQVTIGITTTTTDYTYTAANQIATQKIGSNPITNFSYDANGNLTSDGTNSYTWDKANRLLSFGGIAYAYNGDGNRVSQTASSIVTKYLLDTQPGLALVIAQTTGANTERYIHAPRGIHAVEMPTGAWNYMVQDGLGSVRGEISAAGAMLGSRSHAPYGTVSDSTGAFSSSFGYAGEQIDGNGLSYNRKRYYHPELGNWVSLDPLELGNRYVYVKGNPILFSDSSGLQDIQPGLPGPNPPMPPPPPVSPPVTTPPGIPVPSIGEIIAEIIIEDPGILVPAVIDGPIPGGDIITGLLLILNLAEELHGQTESRLGRNVEKIEEIRRRRREKECDCNKLPLPQSRELFIDNKDLLCALECYGGAKQALWYKGSLEQFGVEIRLIPSDSGEIRAEGHFAPPYWARNIGGRILVKQPGNNTRSLVLAVFIEELAHATHYHNMFVGSLVVPPSQSEYTPFDLPSCSQMLTWQTEIDAKLRRNDWVLWSGIPRSAFGTWSQTAKFYEEAAFVAELTRYQQENPYKWERHAFFGCGQFEPFNSNCETSLDIFSRNLNNSGYIP
jgi:RHS repeat-associated protein